MTTSDITTGKPANSTAAPSNLVPLQGGNRGGSGATLWDEEAEEFVVSAILLDPAKVYDVYEKLNSPDAIYRETYRLIYKAQIAIALDGNEPDIEATAIQLRRMGVLDKVGGRAYLAELYDSCLSSSGVEISAELISEYAVRRLLKSVAHDNAALAENLSLPIAEVIERSEDLLYGANPAAVNSGLSSSAELSDELKAFYSSATPLGLRAGWLDFDELTGGWYPGSLNVIAGPTGLGKTHSGIDATIRFARLHRLPCFYFTCEMSKVELANRFIANLSGVDSSILLESNKPNGKRLSPAEEKRRDDALQAFAGLPIFLYESENPSPTVIRQVLRRYATQYPQLGLVVLDYLQLLGGDEGGGENRVRDLDVMARQCKGIAAKYNLPFVALAQVNHKTIATRKDTRPQLGDIRECGAIDMHANRIIFLHQNAYYNKEATDQGLLEIIVAKNRGGKKGDCRMLFIPECSQLKDLAKSY